MFAFSLSRIFPQHGCLWREGTNGLPGLGKIKITLTCVTFANLSFTLNQEPFPQSSGIGDNPYRPPRTSWSHVRIWAVRATWAVACWKHITTLSGDSDPFASLPWPRETSPHLPLSVSWRLVSSFVKRLDKLFIRWFWRFIPLPLRLPIPLFLLLWWKTDTHLTLRSSQHLSFPATPGASPNMDAAETSCSAWPWWRPREKVARRRSYYVSSLFFPSRRKLWMTTRCIYARASRLYLFIFIFPVGFAILQLHTFYTFPLSWSECVMALEDGISLQFLCYLMALTFKGKDCIYVEL